MKTAKDRRAVKQLRASIKDAKVAERQVLRLAKKTYRLVNKLDQLSALFGTIVGGLEKLAKPKAKPTKAEPKKSKVVKKTRKRKVVALVVDEPIAATA